MSPRPDPDHLPAWMRDTLAAPVPSRPDARDAIMRAVTALPASARPRRSVTAPERLFGVARWRRRGALTGLGGALVTGAFALMLTVRHGEELSWRAAVQAEAHVRGDSLVARVGARLLDTLRIVDLALRGPRLGRATITVADARIQATLVRTSSGAEEWHARALVPRDIVALTVLVNGAPHAIRLTPTPDAAPDLAPWPSASPAPAF